MPRLKPISRIGSFRTFVEPIRKGSRNPCDGAVVVTVRATVASDDPFKETELGDTAHVERVGAPLQVRTTV